ncbi:MAG: MBL fold metallo-hydrolase [candidate division Zixibacteria bacterium SM23_81]|nr:MAG: MBL fold metallo-hydrolase [candidate division Zixibacteria bacterium SM23_81]
MKTYFQATQVNDRVYWVGAIDWSIRNFHGYATDRGSTYNAYLILADKVTLVDTVKAPFLEEMLVRIASVIDPRKIDYIISNHSEMDHSGCLPQAIQAVKPEKVFASVMGTKALQEHFHLDREISEVKDGESLSLGNLNLTFLETRMLHWPDSMVTYLAEDKLLFSQDAFGMHLASSERFADQIEDWILNYEAAKYYANILLPFSALVSKLLERVKGLGITIETIAPDHGPIWRKEVSRMPKLYATWAAQRPTNKAVVVYDTMWQSTALMARTIAEGLRAGGTMTKLMPLESCHRSEVVTEVLDAGALLVGSPTINNNMFPTVAGTLAYLKGLKPKNLMGTAFGSYGWSGEAVGQVMEVLAEMKIDLIGDGLKVKYVPDESVLAECFSLGSRVAEKLGKVSS